MSDELERLRTALGASTPLPDPEKRAANLALAMENFDRLQESSAPARPSHVRPKRSGFMTGVREMLRSFTSRHSLATTASIAALCVGVYLVVPAGERPALISLPAPAPAVTPQPAARTDGAEATAPLESRSRDALAQAASPAPEPGADAAAASAVPMATGTVAAVEEEALVMADEAFAGGALMSEAPVVEFAAPAAKVAAPDMMAAPEASTEAYANAAPNPVKVTAEEPVSTFSVDVDTAAWSVVRSSLMRGSLPPAEAVRVEEMVNYFPYAYAAPDDGEAPFRGAISVMATPWNPDTRLVRIALQGRMPATDLRPPLNLVFLIDTSGSMQDADKLPLLKQSFRLMLGQLRPQDQVAIVTYAGSAGQVLAPTAASDSATILSALDRLEAGGSTAGQEGLSQAYQVARGMAAEGEVTRVILATDGDFNVGISDPDLLKSYIAGERDSGTYLSVLGFGRGNLDDATMQALAQNGNGQAAYIDTLNEARKVLVDQLTGALFPIAGDVKLQVEWNPAAVAEYRLIGYETRALAREDFNNDKVDAGDIGAGHQVTALYEITAPGSPALRNDPLRYATPAEHGDPAELGFLKLRYKRPGEGNSHLIEVPIRPGNGAADDDARFAAAIAGFGQLLRDPKYLGDWGYAQAIELATGARGADAFGYRAEAVNLMRLAQSLTR